MKTLTNQSFKNKKVLIRVDFNVPLNEKLQVVDNTRIYAAKPTIEHVINTGGSCILISHMGRPKGFSLKASLKNIVSEVSKVLNKPVDFHSNCIGEEAEKKSIKPLVKIVSWASVGIDPSLIVLEKKLKKNLSQLNLEKFYY